MAAWRVRCTLPKSTDLFSRTSDWKDGNTARFVKDKKGDQTQSRAKVEFALKMFVGVRGPECLKNAATAVVMRENGECFVTQDVAGVDGSDGKQSLVYLQDLESIRRFNKTYGDSFLRDKS